MQYEFVKNVTVQGVQYASGDVVNGDDLPVGSMESLLATWMVPHVAVIAAVEEKIETAVNESSVTDQHEQPNFKRRNKK